MRTQSKLLTTMVVVLVAGGLSPAARGGTVSVFTNYDDFVAAAGAVRTIDFETLPDGSPSLPGTMITPDFNYTAEGVTFSPRLPNLFLSGNTVSGFGLVASAYPDFDPNWIIADVSPASSAVGIMYIAQNSLSVFNAQGEMLASEFLGGGGWRFLGVVSDDPIARAVIESGGPVTGIESITFTPIPEPSVLLLMIAGAFALARKLPN